MSPGGRAPGTDPVPPHPARGPAAAATAAAPEVRTPGEVVRWGGRSLPALVLGQLVHLTVHGQAQELLPRGPHLLPAGLRGSIKVTSNRIQLLKDSGGPALPTNNAKARK